MALSLTKARQSTTTAPKSSLDDRLRLHQEHTQRHYDAYRGKLSTLQDMMEALATIIAR